MNKKNAVKKMKIDPKVKREQPRRDSKVKRVNYDNARETKFDSDMDKAGYNTKTDRTSKSNDVTWYAHSPEMLKAAASIPFTDVTGEPLPFNTSLSVPGIMAIHFIPNFGGPLSPINQSSNLIYSDTVHANSRNKSYDAPDEMLLILAGGQVFSFLAMGLRAYGTMRRYMQIDRYTPEALITAMGFNYQDLKENLSQMWFDLNELILSTSQIWVPDLLPLIKRWYWMNSNIYMDGASNKAQYYMFVQDAYYQYNETSVSTGGSLFAINWIPDSLLSWTGNTWEQYVTIARGLINSLINSQDRGIIFGDILKAYGADRLYSMQPVSSDYMIEPVYDREVLSQIENATGFAVPTRNFGPLIQVQSGGAPTLKFFPFDGTPDITATLIVANPKHVILNCHQKEAPTPDQIMIMTRLVNAGITSLGNWSSATDSYGYGPTVAGSEICTDFWVYSYGADRVLGYDRFNTCYPKKAADQDQQFTSQAMFKYISFDWAPGLIVTEPWTYKIPRLAGETVYATMNNKFVDYDNYTIISADTTLRKLHTTAMYSLFGVPFGM